MTNISSISRITTTVPALSNLILVQPNSNYGYQPESPNRQKRQGDTIQTPPKFVFNYEGEQTVQIESDITDHYVEDNTAIQDQISLKPEIITTHGYIGELTDIAPEILAPLEFLANKLTVIDAYTPVLSTSARIAYNNAFQLYQIVQNTVAQAVSAWSSINSSQGENVISSNGLGIGFNPLTGQVSGNQNKQQIAFQQLYGYWSNQILFTIQTPWAIFEHMAIQRLRAIQDAETKMITDFEISFKMIRFASSRVVPGLRSPLREGRNFDQNQPVTNLGTQNPAPSVSLSEQLDGVIE